MRNEQIWPYRKRNGLVDILSAYGNGSHRQPEIMEEIQL